MKNIIRLRDVNGISGWEYLGTIAQNGVEFVALQPLDGTNREYFFLSEEGAYFRVTNAKAERALSLRFHQTAMEEARGRLREAR